MPNRRYSVKVAGRSFHFHYRFDQQRYTFSFGDTLHKGKAETLSQAKHFIKQIIRSEPEKGARNG